MPPSRRLCPPRGDTATAAPARPSEPLSGDPAAGAGSPSAGGPRSPPGPPGGACALRPLGAGPAPGAARSPPAAAAYFSHSAGTGPPRGRGTGRDRPGRRLPPGAAGSDPAPSVPSGPSRTVPKRRGDFAEGARQGARGQVRGRAPGTGHSGRCPRASRRGGRQPRRCRGSRPRSPSPSPVSEERGSPQNRLLPGGRCASAAGPRAPGFGLGNEAKSFASPPKCRLRWHVASLVLSREVCPK